MEIIFPIRINEAPVGRLYDKNGNFVQEIKFGISITNPSRATWIADVNIKLDSIRIELELTRDCNLILYMKD